MPAKKLKNTTPNFLFADETIEPGTRKLVTIEAGVLTNNQPLTITADIIHGKKPGPCLLVTACVHGDEINGTEIIRRLLDTPALKRLQGTIIALPIVNNPAFTARSRYLPDRRDLNRIFPGSESGSLGARLAYVISKKVLPKCDAVIDLHTGAVNRPNLPQLRIAGGDEDSLNLGKSFAAPVTLLAPLRPGSFRETAFRLKKPFILYEGGEASRLDTDSIRFGVQGIIAAMRYMKMLPESRSQPKRTQGTISRSSHWDRAPHGGIFLPFVALGKAVAKGETIGLMAPPLGGGDGVPVISSVNGIVIGRNNEGLADEGDALFHIAAFVNADNAEERIQIANDDLPDPHTSEDDHPVRYHPFPDQIS